MITITHEALSVIQQVTAHPMLESDSGLRIAGPGESEARLQVRIVNHPEPGDRVVEQEGGRLYLSPGAVERVSGRELDALTDPEGRVHFVARDAA